MNHVKLTVVLTLFLGLSEIPPDQVFARHISDRSATAAQAATKQNGPDFSVVFEGTIGGHAIQMALMRHGDDVSGSYFYESVGTDIDLSGKIDSKNNVNIQETDPDGKATGVFKGKLESRPSGGETLFRLSGTWSKPDGSGELPLSLDQQHFDLGAGARIVSKNIEKENQKPKYSIDVQYPQIEGSAGPGASGFNSDVESVVLKEVAQFKKDVASNGNDASDENGSDLEISYEVSYASKRSISVILSISNYFAGTAHPNHYTSTVNYDLTSAKPMTLGSLFRTGSPYLPTLSRLCTTRLKKRLGEDSDADWINRGAGAKATNY
ncbi:MAG TPA: DUF4163 domain-containing protein, partial [Blastocatellia bacterium]|nr:DUF4163 domain-containing protein [Blastocatellia bacterium]